MLHVRAQQPPEVDHTAATSNPASGYARTGGPRELRDGLLRARKVGLRKRSKISAAPCRVGAVGLQRDRRIVLRSVDLLWFGRRRTGREHRDGGPGALRNAHRLRHAMVRRLPPDPPKLSEQTIE